MIPTALALEECQRVEEPEDIPCKVTSTWGYTNNCSTYSVNIFNNTGGLINTLNLSDFGVTGLCNFTFNYTSAGSYNYNITSGDTGAIIVEVKMETIAVIIGLTAITFLFLYFAFNLDDNHFLLKLVLIFFSLFTIILIPAALINGVEAIKVTFLSIPMQFFRIFVIYFSVYLFWHWIQKSEKMMQLIENVKGGFKK